MDSRLASHGWLAEVFLEGMPPNGYPRVASGALDATTAWRHALRLLLGVDAERPDVVTVLDWTLDRSFLDRWSGLGDAQRKAIQDWLGSVAGGASRLVLTLVAHDHGADAVPLGIACVPLFDDEHQSNDARLDAIIRLERFTGGVRVESLVGRAFAAAAENVLTGVAAKDPRRASGIVARSDELLRELGGEATARLSKWSPAGYVQRLDAFAAALRSAIEADDPVAALTLANEEFERLSAHERARSGREQVSRAQNAETIGRIRALAARPELRARPPVGPRARQSGPE